MRRLSTIAWRRLVATGAPTALARVLALYLRLSPVATGKPWLLRLCRRWLLPQLPPFQASVRLTPCSSVSLRCFQLGGTHHSDILSEWLLYVGTWQPALTAWLRRTLRHGDTFVDVGANTGYFALLGAALVHAGGQAGDGRVVAVEACARTMDRLRANLALNPSLAAGVRCVEAAAAEGTGELTLYRHRREPLYNTTVAGAGAGGVTAASDVWSVLQASGAARGSAGAAVDELARDGAWQSVRVRSAPLDELLSEAEAASARVVKIDVEGGEWTVLRGMARLLEASRHRPELEVVVELTPKWLQMQGTSAAKLIRHMHAAGFHAYVLREDYEVGRAFPACAEPPRPRRLPLGTPIGCEQADVIFSRRDVEYL